MAEDKRTYWQKRLQAPLHKAYNDNEAATEAFLKVYQDAKKEIAAEIFNVYKKINVEKPLISDFYRYNHLQQIEKQIESMVVKIGKQEVPYTTSALKEAVKTGASATAKNLGIDFSMLNSKAIDEIIKRPWSGNDYSDNIWKNKNKLINTMKSELTNGIIQGKSVYQVSDLLERRLDVGREESLRLVRTEYMHALNEGQKESYKAAGITKVRWVATMDDRTSEQCRLLHNQEFDIDKMPNQPIRPNCRCTNVPVLTTIDKTKLEEKYFNMLKNDQAKQEEIAEAMAKEE